MGKFLALIIKLALLQWRVAFYKSMASVSGKERRSSYEIPTGDTETFSNCDITTFEIQTEDISSPPPPQQGPLYFKIFHSGVSRICYRHNQLVIGLWVVLASLNCMPLSPITITYPDHSTESG